MINGISTLDLQMQLYKTVQLKLPYNKTIHLDNFIYSRRRKLFSTLQIPDFVKTFLFHFRNTHKAAMNWCSQNRRIIDWCASKYLRLTEILPASFLLIYIIE